MKTKKCKKCNTIKSSDDFGFDTKTKDGLRFYCKTCRSNMMKNTVKKWKEQRISHVDKTEKRCSICKEIKPISCFCKDCCRKDGYHVWCDTCRKQKHKKYRQNYIKNNQEKVKTRNREQVLKNHKIRQEEYDKMYFIQSGRCAICNTHPKTPLHIDHNHHTGKTRGLLCSKCNLGIGNLQDSPDICLKASQYLLKFL